MQLWTYTNGTTDIYQWTRDYDDGTTNYDNGLGTMTMGLQAMTMQLMYLTITEKPMYLTLIVLITRFTYYQLHAHNTEEFKKKLFPLL